MAPEVVRTQLELLEILVWVIFTNLTLQNIIPGTRKSPILTCLGDRSSAKTEAMHQTMQQHSCTQSDTVFVVGQKMQTGKQVGTRVAVCAVAADRRSELSLNCVLR